MALQGRRKAVAFTLVAVLGVGLIGGVGYAVSPEVRAAAVGPLEAAGADGALAALVTDPDEGVRVAAGSAVARRGAAAVPALVRRLDASERDERILVIAAVARAGPAARAAAPALKRLVWDDPDRSTRRNAATALYQVAGDEPDTLADFLLLLETGDDPGRATAAEVLARYGDRPREVVPPLARALQDRNPEVRDRAAESLGRLGPAAAALKPGTGTPGP